jgi:macrolide-specific efflux system membrane fusion protein
MAIATTGGSHTVVMADGQSRTVSIGIQGDTYTQITSGLADGDQIQLVSGRAAAAANGNTGRGQFAGPGQFPGIGGQGGPVGQTGQGGQGANRGR